MAPAATDALRALRALRSHPRSTSCRHAANAAFAILLPGNVFGKGGGEEGVGARPVVNDGGNILSGLGRRRSLSDFSSVVFRFPAGARKVPWGFARLMRAHLYAHCFITELLLRIVLAR